MNKYSTGYKPKAQAPKITVDDVFIAVIVSLGSIVVIEQIMKFIERGF